MTSLKLNIVVGRERSLSFLSMVFLVVDKLTVEKQHNYGKINIQRVVRRQI